MTLRERFLATIRFQEVDRPWRFETIGFWDETIRRWHGEGLPQWVFGKEAAFLFYRFDHWMPAFVGADGTPGFFPPFVPKVLKREGRTEIVRDMTGNIHKQFRDGSATIPQHIGSPVENMDDFRELRWRLEPDFPGRCDNPVWNASFALAKRLDAPVGVHVSGLFAFHRHLMGVEKLMYAYFDQPDLVHTMCRQWVRLCVGVIRRFARMGDVTLINFWEDMCYKTGPIISPRIFREFLTPYYKQVIEAARECGVECFMVDTDGNCTLLIPLFVEVGVNFLYPFEVQAGMDILAVRAEWGNKLVIMGGLNKRALEGTVEDIEHEVESKVPEMLKTGGYVPALDHAVHPGVPFRNFEHFLRIMRRKYGKEKSGIGI